MSISQLVRQDLNFDGVLFASKEEQTEPMYTRHHTQEELDHFHMAIDNWESGVFLEIHHEHASSRFGFVSAESSYITSTFSKKFRNIPEEKQCTQEICTKDGLPISQDKFKLEFERCVQKSVDAKKMYTIDPGVYDSDSLYYTNGGAVLRDDTDKSKANFLNLFHIQEQDSEVRKNQALVENLQITMKKAYDLMPLDTQAKTLPPAAIEHQTRVQKEVNGKIVWAPGPMEKIDTFEKITKIEIEKKNNLKIGLEQRVRQSGKLQLKLERGVYLKRCAVYNTFEKKMEELEDRLGTSAQFDTESTVLKKECMEEMFKTAEPTDPNYPKMVNGRVLDFYDASEIYFGINDNNYTLEQLKNSRDVNPGDLQVASTFQEFKFDETDEREEYTDGGFYLEFKVSLHKKYEMGNPKYTISRKVGDKYELTPWPRPNSFYKEQLRLRGIDESAKKDHAADKIKSMAMSMVTSFSAGTVGLMTNKMDEEKTPEMDNDSKKLQQLQGSIIMTSKLIDSELPRTNDAIQILHEKNRRVLDDHHHLKIRGQNDMMDIISEKQEERQRIQQQEASVVLGAYGLGTTAQMANIMDSLKTMEKNQETMKKNQEKQLAELKAATNDRKEKDEAAAKDRKEKDEAAAKDRKEKDEAAAKDRKEKAAAAAELGARIEKSLGKIAGLQQKTLEGLEDVKTQNKSLLHKVDFIGQKLTKMEGMLDTGFANMATNFALLNDKMDTLQATTTKALKVAESTAVNQLIMQKSLKKMQMTGEKIHKQMLKERNVRRVKLTKMLSEDQLVAMEVLQNQFQTNMEYINRTGFEELDNIRQRVDVVLYRDVIIEKRKKIEEMKYEQAETLEIDDDIMRGIEKLESEVKDLSIEQKVFVSLTLQQFLQDPDDFPPFQSPFEIAINQEDPKTQLELIKQTQKMKNPQGGPVTGKDALGHCVGEILVTPEPLATWNKQKRLDIWKNWHEQATKVVESSKSGKKKFAQFREFLHLYVVERNKILNEVKSGDTVTDTALLQQLLANQETILANQDRMEANQKTMIASLDRIESKLDKLLAFYMAGHFETQGCYCHYKLEAAPNGKGFVKVAGGPEDPKMYGRLEKNNNILGWAGSGDLHANPWKRADVFGLGGAKRYKLDKGQRVLDEDGTPILEDIPGDVAHKCYVANRNYDQGDNSNPDTWTDDELREWALANNIPEDSNSETIKTAAKTQNSGLAGKTIQFMERAKSGLFLNSLGYIFQDFFFLSVGSLQTIFNVVLGLVKAISMGSIDIILQLFSMIGLWKGSTGIAMNGLKEVKDNIYQLGLYALQLAKSIATYFYQLVFKQPYRIFCSIGETIQPLLMKLGELLDSMPGIPGIPLGLDMQAMAKNIGVGLAFGLTTVFLKTMTSFITVFLNWEYLFGTLHFNNEETSTKKTWPTTAEISAGAPEWLKAITSGVVLDTAATALFYIKTYIQTFFSTVHELQNDIQAFVVNTCFKGLVDGISCLFNFVTKSMRGFLTKERDGPIGTMISGFFNFIYGITGKIGGAVSFIGRAISGLYYITSKMLEGNVSCLIRPVMNSIFGDLMVSKGEGCGGDAILDANGAKTSILATGQLLEYSNFSKRMASTLRSFDGTALLNSAKNGVSGIVEGVSAISGASGGVGIGFMAAEANMSDEEIGKFKEMETKLSGQDLLNMMTPDRSELLNSRAIKEAGYKARSMGTTAADSFESLSKEEQKTLLDSCYKEKLDFTLFITQDTRKMVSGVNVAVEIAKEPNTAAKKEATDSFFSSLLKMIKTMAWKLFSGVKSSVQSVGGLLGKAIAWIKGFLKKWFVGDSETKEEEPEETEEADTWTDEEAEKYVVARMEEMNGWRTFYGASQEDIDYWEAHKDLYFADKTAAEEKLKKIHAKNGWRTDSRSPEEIEQYNGLKAKFPSLGYKYLKMLPHLEEALTHVNDMADLHDSHGPNHPLFHISTNLAFDKLLHASGFSSRHEIMVEMKHHDPGMTIDKATVATMLGYRDHHHHRHHQLYNEHHPMVHSVEAIHQYTNQYKKTV